jgi:hypothetical protein
MLPFECLGELGQHLGQLAAALAGAHQAHIHLVEGLGMLGHGLRQRLARAQPVHQPADHLAQRRVGLGVFHVVQGLHQRHAGAQHHGHLEAEVDQVQQPDARAHEAQRTAMRARLDQQQAGLLQLRGQCAFVRRDTLAADARAVGGQGGPFVARHAACSATGQCAARLTTRLTSSTVVWPAST